MLVVVSTQRLVVERHLRISQEKARRGLRIPLRPGFRVLARPFAPSDKGTGIRYDLSRRL